MGFEGQKEIDEIVPVNAMGVLSTDIPDQDIDFDISDIIAKFEIPGKDDAEKANNSFKMGLTSSL